MRSLSATPVNNRASAIPATYPYARILVIGLLLAAFALRLYRLGGESLWYDETVSVYLAAQPVTELVAHTARDIHPPAYYLLLHYWRLLANPSVAFGLEFLYAWPSLFADFLVVLLTYAIARRCFGAGASLWALALAGLQPTQIWFAQEVRMYSLGALALMLTLWAVTPWLANRERQDAPARLPRLTLVLYPLAALLGLYTLYYFFFWLVALTLAFVVAIWPDWRLLRSWLLLQIVVVIGWLPWLPTLLHQALTPPVPAWRIPWQSVSDVVAASSEALAALWFAHIVPFAITWPWAMGALLAGAAFLFLLPAIKLRVRIQWLLLCFGPLLLLLTVSLIGPPIYHVRYVSTYAPLFVLLTAALLAGLPRLPRLLTFVLVMLVSALSLHDLWTNPLYAADDHRSAVSALAREWRPGDAILVNAGWVYTALAVYWPTELPSPDATRPPAIAGYTRLNDEIALDEVTNSNAPTITRSGSVDGDTNLGWGLPESDFFAVSAQKTTASLAQLAATHPRIWHYRLYDTVSDPDGVIRKWLSENTQMEESRPVPGRDFLRTERYRTATLPPLPVSADGPVLFPEIGLSLTGHNHPPSAQAGETLFVNLAWAAPDANALPALPALSLRLYDPQGNFILQSDAPLSAQAGESNNQSLALAIPADTIPGSYNLELVVYSPTDLAPYAAITSEQTQLPSPLPLGDVTVQLPTTIPHTSAPLATFDYIDLLANELSTNPHQPGASIDTSWTWRPNPSDYRDRYIAHLQLADGQSPPVELSEFTLGGDAYPSSSWPEFFPLKQRLTLNLPATLQPGTYQVRLSLTRASDGKSIDARQPWSFWPQPFANVGEISIEAAP